MNDDRAGVTVLGSVNLDLVLRSARLPVAGETVAGAEISESLGGKGANQAIAAARMGAAVALIACLGDDAAGRAALDTFAREEIDTALCRTVSDPTGRAAVLVDTHGENLISVGTGANGRLAIDDARSPWPDATAVLLTQLEIPAATVTAGLAAARQRDVASVLNATPAERLDELAQMPDVLVVNRVEAERLSGATDGSARTARALADTLARERGIATVIVTDGGDGAAAAIDGGSGQAIVVTAPVVEVVDTTGAGDAFAGTLAALLAERVALSDALAYACTAGALACTGSGAVPSLPRRSAVLARH
jgi:ribokinase